MRAGDLNKRITVTERVHSQNSIGQPVDDWSVFMETWGDARYQTGLQRLSGESAHAGTRCSVRIRSSEKSKLIKRGMRLRVDGIVFNITDILPQGRVAIDLICEIVSP